MKDSPSNDSDDGEKIHESSPSADPPLQSPVHSNVSTHSVTMPTVLPSRFQLTWRARVALWLLMTLSMISLAVILDSFAHHQRDVSGCHESYMRPQYIRHTAFDSEMTRFAGKYSLYLYREKGVDLSEQPMGVPVLFIPGHAGSYKQVRSIAAESAYYYYQNYARHADTWGLGMRHLDFFTVDFNEEFSALHGQSLLDQAEYLNDAIDYILKLYPQSRRIGPRANVNLPDPTSVILVGHSMGGTVARTMFTLHNYQPGTINTVVTLSTPHLLPPAPFDWKISKIYDDIQQYWSNGYANDSTTSSLRDVSLVSIAGGTLDSVVCSDSANVGAFLPATHGFTVFSTAVPQVWTGTDHISILSCNQLVKVLAKSMLDIVDVRRGTQTKSIEDRMAVFRKAFLSGLEYRHGDGSDLGLGGLAFFDLTRTESHFLQAGHRLLLRDGESSPVKMSFLPMYKGADAFSVLSSMSIGKNERFDLMLCTKLERHVPLKTRVGCRSAKELVVPFPASTSADVYPFSGNTFSFASIAFEEMEEYEYLAIMDRGGSSGFLLAEAFSRQHNTHTVEKSMMAIAYEGVQLQLQPALFTSIRIPAIESPMLAYHLKVSRPSCRAKDSVFAPFMRQSIATMHESKFYVNLAGSEDETDVSIHGRTAFSPMAVNPRDEADHRGLELQIWADPTTCDQPIGINLSIDWYGSAGRIGFRNGIMLATFSFVVVILVFVAQIRCYTKTGIYPHFGQGLVYVIQRSLPVTLVLVGLCSIYQTTTPPRSSVLHQLWSMQPASIAWQDVLTGNSDPFFWWLAPAGLIMSIGIVCLLWILVESVLRCCATLSTFFNHHHRWIRRLQRTNESRWQRLQRRVITTLVLFLLVATCIPYQFVFVVAFLVHIITCVRALTRTWTKTVTQELRWLNRYHYMQSILFLFITLLPFNLPILVVWIRNLSVHWLVPFSSDHNVFSIAPFMIYVELLTSHRRMLPRLSHRLCYWITYGLCYGIVVYAFLYSIKYTHSLYFMSNYLISWILFIHFCTSQSGQGLYHYLGDHLVYPFPNKKSS